MYRQVLLRGSGSRAFWNVLCPPGAQPPAFPLPWPRGHVAGQIVSPAGWLCFIPSLAPVGQRPAPASPSSARGARRVGRWGQAMWGKAAGRTGGVPARPRLVSAGLGEPKGRGRVPLAQDQGRGSRTSEPRLRGLSAPPWGVRALLQVCCEETNTNL